MPRMSNTLGLPEPKGIRDPAVRELLNQWRQILEDKYKDTFTDVHHKQMTYYDVGGLKWRIGPYPPRTASLPNGDFSANVSDWEFELQFFTGTDYAHEWLNDSNWKRKWRMRGGTD